jgi:hypothetical protein
MRRIAFLFLLPLFAQALTAQDQPNDKKAPTPSSELNLQISTLPEIKLGFTNRYTIPFLQGESPLTQDNNISLALSSEITPISLNGLAEAVWTPIAFLQLSAGGRIGSGWKLNLFGSDLYGIGLNVPDAVGKTLNDGSAFDGLLWKVQTGGTVQFDLAAIFPGDWNHVVARSYHEINYKGYTQAKRGIPGSTKTTAAKTSTVLITTAICLSAIKCPWYSIWRRFSRKPIFICTILRAAKCGGTIRYVGLFPGFLVLQLPNSLTST